MGCLRDKLNLRLLLRDTDTSMLLNVYTLYRSVYGVSAGPGTGGYTREWGHVAVSMSNWEN